MPTTTASASMDAARTIGVAAAIIMAGNLSSSILGFVRSAVVVGTFGVSRVTDAFTVAQVIPQMFFDLTVGAAVSAALIPTFTEILGRDGRKRLAETVGAVLGLAWIALTVVVVALILLARPLVEFILRNRLAPSSPHDPVLLVQIILPSLLFLGTSAVLLSTLYAARRFTVAAFASCSYHLGIIAGALFLARPFGVAALSVGAVAGAVAQMAVQIPAIIRTVGTVRPRVSLTPEVRKILRLYLPVAAGVIISVVGQILDLGFKWHQGSGAPAAMGLATQLTQFPIGIAVVALGFATLRTISVYAAEGDTERFKTTLVTGIRLVLFLTIPAAIAYLILASPICTLLWQNNKAGPVGIAKAVTALDGYAIQIPFVGLDQLLIAAFYARGNTTTPMLIGVVGVAIYIVGALLLQTHLHILGLALANTIQNSAHALILFVLLIGAIGSLRGLGLAPGIVKTLLAGAGMAAAAVGTATVVSHVMTEHTSLFRVADALAPLTVAAGCYVVLAWLLRSEELALLRDLVAERLALSRSETIRETVP